MKEIVVATPKLPDIAFDFAEAEATLSKELEAYKKLVVTEDTIPGCKKSRADLNKVKLSIDTERKRIKREWNEPFTRFEEKVKNLVGMCDDGLKYLDDGLNVYEQKRIAEKTRICNELLETKIEGGVEGCGDEMFSNKLHLPIGFANATMTMQGIENDIDIQIINLRSEQEKLHADIQTAKNHILSMNKTFVLKSPLTETDFERHFRPEYFDLSYLIEEITNRAKSRNTVENRVEEIITEKKVELAEPINPSIEPIKNEPKQSYTLEIECTPSQYKDLEQYLIARGIVYQDQLCPF